MSVQGARQFVLGFHPDRLVVVETAAAPLSSEGGLLVTRELDERLGFTAQSAAALKDTRESSWTRHDLQSTMRQRFFGVLADYDHQDDHDEVLSDPVFKLIADRLATNSHYTASQIDFPGPNLPIGITTYTPPEELVNPKKTGISPIAVWTTRRMDD